MENHEFKLNSGADYIPLDKLLKLKGLVGTGGEAHIRIDLGEVSVDGSIEKQRRKKLHPGAVVEFDGQVIKIVA